MHQGPLKQAVFQPSSPDPTGGGGDDLWLLRGIRAFCYSDTSLYIRDHAQLFTSCIFIYHRSTSDFVPSQSSNMQSK